MTEDHLDSKVSPECLDSVACREQLEGSETPVPLDRREILATEVWLEVQDLKDLRVDWDQLVKVDYLDRLVHLVRQDPSDLAVNVFDPLVTIAS